MEIEHNCIVIVDDEILQLNLYKVNDWIRIIRISVVIAMK